MSSIVCYVVLPLETFLFHYFFWYRGKMRPICHYTSKWYIYIYQILQTNWNWWTRFFPFCFRMLILAFARTLVHLVTFIYTAIPDLHCNPELKDWRKSVRESEKMGGWWNKMKTREQLFQNNFSRTWKKVQAFTQGVSRLYAASIKSQQSFPFPPLCSLIKKFVPLYFSFSIIWIFEYQNISSSNSLFCFFSLFEMLKFSSNLQKIELIFPPPSCSMNFDVLQAHFSSFLG